MRTIKFQTGEYYHIYNRGVDKRNVFMDDRDFIRFLMGMREFNRIEPIGSLHELNQLRKKNRDPISKFANANLEIGSLVEIIAYCLIPNHYHFILRQLSDNGIAKFMHKIGIGYTMYFNEKHKRSGSLFQGKYKFIPIENSYYLCKLLVYVNYNYEIHNLGKNENWPWSSYLDVVGKRNGTLCNLNIIKEEFGLAEEFKKLAVEIIPEIKENKKLRGYLLE